MVRPARSRPNPSRRRSRRRARRQRRRLLQRQGDPRAAGHDPAGGRRPARPAHRPPAAPGVDLGHGARLRRRAPPPLRRPRAVPAVGRVRRPHRLLLHPPARHRRRAELADTAARSPSSRRPCSAPTTSSTPSTPGSPRSRSTTPTQPTRCSPPSSAPRGARNWHQHFRTWRKQRLREIEVEYGDRARRGRRLPRRVRRQGQGARPRRLPPIDLAPCRRTRGGVTMARGRRRQLGGIDRLPSGRWRARVLDPGTGQRVSIGSFTTKAGAERAFAAAVTDQQKGAWVTPADGRIDLATYATRWVATCPHHPRRAAPPTRPGALSGLPRQPHPADAWLENTWPAQHSAHPTLAQRPPHRWRGTVDHGEVLPAAASHPQHRGRGSSPRGQSVRDQGRGHRERRGARDPRQRAGLRARRLGLGPIPSTRVAGSVRWAAQRRAVRLAPIRHRPPSSQARGPLAASGVQDR